MLMPMERLFKKNKLYSFIHLMGFIFLLPLQGSATPEIAVDEVIHHYGVLYAEDQPAVSHQFIVSNNGNEPLVINDIQSSCGCTKAEISRSEIPPGETAVLDTTLSRVKNREESKSGSASIPMIRTIRYLKSASPATLYLAGPSRRSAAFRMSSQPDPRMKQSYGSVPMSNPVTTKGSYSMQPVNILLSMPFCSMKQRRLNWMGM